MYVRIAVIQNERRKLALADLLMERYSTIPASYSLDPADPRREFSLISFIANATLTKADIEASNRNIHVIDTVVMP